MYFALFYLNAPVYIESVSTKDIGGIIITEAFENKKIIRIVV